MATTRAAETRTEVGEASLGRLHALLGAQSAILVLASVNRLTDFTTAYVAANEFLRWLDLLNMLVLPLASLVALYLVKREIERGPAVASGAALLALDLAFIVGVYLLAASYGNHEVTNYLHVRYCLEDSSDLEALPPASRLCRIIAFNDDEFSHWVFFAGFVLVNGVLLLMQRARPLEVGRVRGLDVALLVANGVFIGLAVFANLGFEAIGLDLYVVALLAVLSVWLLWRGGRQPLYVYYSTAYALGLVLTGVWQLRGG